MAALPGDCCEGYWEAVEHVVFWVLYLLYKGTREDYATFMKRKFKRIIMRECAICQK